MTDSLIFTLYLMKKWLTARRVCVIVGRWKEIRALFFVLKNAGSAVLFLLYKYVKRHAEVEKMRTKITLACTECKNRNYNMTKDKKTHPDRMETKKYCKFCKTHTLHKETK